MNSFIYDDLYEAYTPADAKEEAYWEALEAHWYKMRPAHITKDWEELNWYEQDNIKRSYEEEQERINFPNRYYGVEPRCRN